MSDVFFTADLHLGHVNCAKHRGFSSVEEHDQYIEDGWKCLIGKKDVVWCLGDVALNAQGVRRFGALPGIKHLVLGNHDHPISRLLPYVNKVAATPVYKRRWILSHVPIHPGQIVDRWRIPNIHGHIHGDRSGPPEPFYFNINVEQWDYLPISEWDLAYWLEESCGGVFNEEETDEGLESWGSGGRETAEAA